MSNQRRGVLVWSPISLVLLASMVGWLPPTAAAATTSCHGHPATIEATAGSDTITGTASKDVIVARQGTDTIDGRGGDDWICGGPGRDTIAGNAGNDHVYGQNGGDTVIEGSGNDHDSGGKHGLYGDALTYEFVDEPLTMRMATNSATAGADRDEVSGFDSYRGTSGNDRFIGSAGRDRFLGGPGNDDISGYLGQDYLEGDAGDDTVAGGRGDDHVEGGGGFDRLTDMRGDNEVFDLSLSETAGGAVIATGPGDDDVYAEAADREADYTVTSGDGADDVHVYGTSSDVRLGTGSGNDLVQVDDGAASLRVRTQQGNDTLELLPDAGQHASGGAGEDLVRFPLDYPDITVRLGAHGHLSAPVDMSLPAFEDAWSGYGDDTIIGSGDRNVIFSGDGNDDLSGLGGNDRLNASYDSNDVARGGAGRDRCLNAETTFSCAS
ncbi:MAG TPA: calcium-binding protein [Nocardioidaceae bacterium]|nr:calcium-binding protein [Nocardioidaceae bacterium]